MIYNGDGQDVSDRNWLGKAQQRFELYETEGGRPEHAVLQSWTDKPDRVLPETQGTFTNLILRYTRPRTRLQVTASAGRVAGRLLAAKPVAGARVRLSVERTYDESAYPSSGSLAASTATTDAAGRFTAVLKALPEATIVARYPGSTRYWPAYAVAATGARLRNVARGRPVVASAEQTTEPSAYAVDGDATTRWGAGQFAPQWIEIDLGAEIAIAAIRLGVDQFPDGDTVHAVLGRPPAGAYRELHVFRGRTTTGQLLEYLPPAPWDGIRYLRVETRASPSWVAWREVEVFVSG
ncbi:MAG TPA: discoidin domain-containing protein [Gemmatimonadaceae bacterium]|nr:discoidin domain-containing protein [Gemmatimonadaceae bacterium]